ncbi:hypothetical protein FAZ19_18860 [Sphingobacterium alkalisoli]|uniref:Nuclease-associated modular DNA-binding 1 domain-containing protein n=1 Tax=Sphingobacterium alkalisoli TaxID=1874115 RepID=A0A4U0GWZ8_9SPHI|nr:NUMOD1 domain-containing DNA-binding protein [Sphingobacterium alkalisoli]TJY63633.1 hypothetical protein FAZ19_18860 [Sphingobacterium alkalisoli]GGH27286.1 hypothetical protein GCM10011418_37150 [Sphingobacterium alkalisoli]
MKKRTITAPVLPPYQNKDLADLPGEEWKDLPGLEGYGMISNLGRIKRLSYELTNSVGQTSVFAERIQAQKINRTFNNFKQDFKQHFNSRIQVGKVTHSISVGRVMYYCFVEQFDLSDRSLYVTYKDGNGLNVIPDNLVLVDLSGLQQRIMQADRKDLHFGHSEENQKVFSQLGRDVNIKKVSQYNMEGHYLHTYESLSQAAEAVGATISAISAATKKKALTAVGYIWRLGSSKKNVAVRNIHKAIRRTKGAPVSQYDLEGRRIATYYNMSQAAEVLGLERKVISDAVNGRVLVTASSVWRKGEAETIDTSREQRSLSLRKGYTVSQYDLEGNKVRTFTNSKEAASFINVQTERINAMAIRDDLLLKGYIWRYGEEPQLGAEELSIIRNNVAKPKTKDITQYDLKGKRLGYYPHITAASRETSVHAGGINGCVDGHKATAGGFIWRRGKGKAKLVLPVTPRPLGHKLSRKVIQYNLKGREIARYPSIKSASRALGIHNTTISAAIRGDNNTAGGFRWKKVE